MAFFNVLGPLELNTKNGTYIPRGPKIRKITSLLLLRCNQIVDYETIAEELWDASPPTTMVATIRTHVYHLRRMLEDECDLSPLVAELRTQSAGYLLRVDEDQLDAKVFARLVDEGRSLMRQGRLDEAGETLCRALEMWRGPALANVTVGRVIGRHLVQLSELRNRALELRIEVDLLRGQHRDLVAELRGLVAADPLNEWLQAQLMEALHRSGRRNEALIAYREVRRILEEELGLAPSTELQELHHKILNAGHHRIPQPTPALASTRRTEAS